ncbi:piggyBac transposable element-derived protein 3 [Trichinella spiralis]|uniref:piggyBac transposable element-derived protein 3 n=1 Tax=Trichinella spiralis TaxID=6334 RepID=UPI0001EFCA7C|nr:piggyBac transposable element-derived protein 3 [Trichinella spiralis]
MALRFLTLENVIDYLETLPPEQMNAEVCQLPPLCEDSNLTDEEQIEENDLAEVMPLDVCGELDVTLDSDVIEDADDFYESSDSQTWSKRKSLNHVFENIPVLPLSTLAPELISLNPIELFYKIMPKEEMAHFAEMTERYALQKGVTLSVEEEDIEKFFGLLLLSGYNCVPCESMFWSTDEDLAVPIARATMSRNRFYDLKKYFHIVDNMTLQEGDKLAKISPMYENMGKRLRQWGIFSEALSIDQCMVPYHGNRSCKMFIKGKEIRFGFKVWTMASSSGYPYAMQIYAGKERDRYKEPLGFSVVKEMVSHLSEPNKYHVYFDNFFTSPHLMKELTQKGIKATGTIRDARIRNCPLMRPEVITEKSRGYFDHTCDGDMYVCRWNDNVTVTIASNYHTHFPVGSVKRYSRAEKKHVNITQPNIIRQYNKCLPAENKIKKMVVEFIFTCVEYGRSGSLEIAQGATYNNQ